MHSGCLLFVQEFQNNNWSPIGLVGWFSLAYLPMTENFQLVHSNDMNWKEIKINQDKSVIFEMAFFKAEE